MTPSLKMAGRKENKQDMTLDEYIPVLDCALRSADCHIAEVSRSPLNHDEIRVFLADESFLTIGIAGLPLLDILGLVTVAIIEERNKDARIEGGKC